MSPGALSGLAAGLVFLSLAASPLAMAKAPPSPPGPARPTSQKVVIRPVPEAPGHYLLQQNRADTLFTGMGLSLRLTPAERPARELHWGVAGARSVTPQPLAPRAARFHQLVGPRESWKQNLPTWGALYYPRVSRGVDLWFEAREGGVTYSLRAERGADLRQVRLEWRGAQALRLAEGGRALEVVLADGVLREEGLLCGQEAADGTSFEVPCRYRSVHPKGPGLWEYVIEVDVKQPGRPAWVDPTIQWNTFLGGNADEELRGLAVHPTLGESFVVGSTRSSFVIRPPPLPDPVTLHGVRVMSDVIVTRFSSSGSVIWTTVIGGKEDDFGHAIVFGVDHFNYIAGTTSSNDFPQGAQAETSTRPLPFHAGKEGFIARLSSDGATLDWVQFLGDDRDDEILSLALGPPQPGDVTGATQKLYAAGWTTSLTLPGADVGDSKESKDLFVSRIDYLSGTVERTLIRRGNGQEEATGIVAETKLAAGGDTHLYVTGYTTSSNFPAAGGYPARLIDSEGTIVVFKLDQELAATPLWEQLLGAPGYDRSSALVLIDNQLTIVGTTDASEFPTTDNTHPVGKDAVLAGFDAQAGHPLFSTVVGGPGTDEGFALAPGDSGSFYIGGRTTSTTLPATEETVDLATSGGSEGFVIRMGLEGARFVPEWSFFVGGSQNDEVRALVAITRPPALVIGGVSQSETLARPTMGTVGQKRVSSGGKEMFLFTMDAKDLTPAKGTVLDGAGSTDLDATESTTSLEANWTISDPETDINKLEVSVGTAPGCNDIMDFIEVSSSAVSLSSSSGQLPTLKTGRWYFVNVRATNGVDISKTISSDGIFVLQPGGNPDPATFPPRPPRPASADLCGDDDPDGGDGDPAPGESPLGFGLSCGTPGGPTAFVLLVVVAFGLLSARRKGWN